MSKNRGIVLLAQNLYADLEFVKENPKLKPEYQGVKVDVWYDELEHYTGQHVYVENSVYRIKDYQKNNTKFNIDNAVLIKDNVKLISDSNRNLKFSRPRNNNIVLKDNFLYQVLQEDIPNIVLTPQYEGINVDIWYRELEHVAGQHVYYENAVYRIKKQVPVYTDFSDEFAEKIIDNIKLFDDENLLLSFDQIKVFDIILSNKKLYSVEAEKKVDYVEQACLLAMSLKVTNPNEKISLVTNDAVPNHYKNLFDQILSIPFNDDALNSGWKIENRWKIYFATPYDETIVLDTDMLILQDISTWWEVLSNYELFFTNKVYTYRDEIVESDYYRKAFTSNNLPNIYTGLYYFKKTKFTANFFNLLEIIVKNWKEFYEIFLPKNTPNFVSIDVAAAIAVKLLDCEDLVTNKILKFPAFTHMKSKIQNWETSSNRWQDNLGIYIDRNCNVKLGNYHQTGILHYTEKDFVTSNIIERYRNYLHV